MRRYVWPVLGLLTVLTYNTWVLWRVNGHVQIFNGYLSEFSASDQPHSFFFRGGDLLTAVIVLVLVLRARHLTHVRGVWGRWEVLVWLGLLLFGVSTFLDAFFSMDCSPTLSEACRVAEETGRLSVIHYAHTWTSVGAQTGIVTSMVAAYVALRLNSARPAAPRSRRGPRVRRLVLVLALVEVVALVVMMGLLVAAAPGLGYPQAVMVLAASFWFAAVGFDLVGPGPADPAGASTTLEQPAAR